MLCLKCGIKTTSKTFKCSECQNIIAPLAPYSPHISQLIREIDSINKGKSDVEDFENMIEELFHLFDELEAIQNNLKKDVPLECRTFFQKIQDATLLLFDGLDEIDIYFEDFDIEHLNEGLQLLKDAEEQHMSLLKTYNEL